MYKYVNMERVEKAAAFLTGNYRLNHFWGSMMSKTLRTTGSRSFNAHEVLPGVYVGDVYAAHNARELKKRNITHVVNAVLAVEPPFPDQFKYLHVQLLDYPGQNIADHLEQTNKFIHEAIAGGGKVFVHCLQGISRSATIAAAYAIYTQRITTKEAIALLRQSRSIVCPNHGFVKQLESFERKLSKQGGCCGAQQKDIELRVMNAPPVCA